MLCETSLVPSVSACVSFGTPCFSPPRRALFTTRAAGAAFGPPVLWPFVGRFVCTPPQRPAYSQFHTVHSRHSSPSVTLLVSDFILASSSVSFFVPNRRSSVALKNCPLSLPLLGASTSSTFSSPHSRAIASPRWTVLRDGEPHYRHQLLISVSICLSSAELVVFLAVHTPTRGCSQHRCTTVRSVLRMLAYSPPAFSFASHS